MVKRILVTLTGIVGIFVAAILVLFVGKISLALKIAIPSFVLALIGMIMLCKYEEDESDEEDEKVEKAEKVEKVEKVESVTHQDGFDRERFIKKSFEEFYKDFRP